jgi:hypothetical protein
MKIFIEPKQAYVLIKEGKTVKYDMLDGHATLKETESKGIYEFSIYDKVAPTSVATLEVNAFALRKILSKKENQGEFYIEGDANDKGHNESGRSSKVHSGTASNFKKLSQYIKRYYKQSKS